MCVLSLSLFPKLTSHLFFFLSLVFSVDDDLRVQITDNALARDLFPQDYHCLGDNENRPIKWLAIESLLNKTFSTASDVVSERISFLIILTIRIIGRSFRSKIYICVH